MHSFYNICINGKNTFTDHLINFAKPQEILI